MTHARWIEVGRILLTGAIALMYWQQMLPIAFLWIAVAIGLYSLVKTGLFDLVRERKIGTEIFVTVATLIALFGGEAIAGAVGGIVSSTLLTLLVLPALYRLLHRDSQTLPVIRND